MLITDVPVPGIVHFIFNFFVSKGVWVLILNTKVAVIPAPEYINYTELSKLAPLYIPQIEKMHWQSGIVKNYAI